MHVSYNRLWKLLIDKGINKSQLCKQAKISTNAMAKLGKNEDVRVEVRTKSCEELRCSIGEIWAAELGWNLHSMNISIIYSQ